MRTFNLLLLASITLAGCVLKDDGHDKTGTSAQALEACGTSGDQDGDGVADAADSSQTDSCLLDPHGFGLNDCATGAGDGLPDCE